MITFFLVSENAADDEKEVDEDFDFLPSETDVNSESSLNTTDSILPSTEVDDAAEDESLDGFEELFDFLDNQSNSTESADNSTNETSSTASVVDDTELPDDILDTSSSVNPSDNAEPATNETDTVNVPNDVPLPDDTDDILDSSSINPSNNAEPSSNETDTVNVANDVPLPDGTDDILDSSSINTSDNAEPSTNETDTVNVANDVPLPDDTDDILDILDSGNSVNASDITETTVSTGELSENQNDDDFEFPTIHDSDEIEAANKTFAEIIGNDSEETGSPAVDFKFPEIVENDSLSPFDIEDGEVKNGEVNNDEETELNDEAIDIVDVADTEGLSINEDSNDDAQLSNESTEEDYKKYEIANSRFYISADNQYTGIVYGVSDTVRFIKMNHMEGYGNQNVSVVFIRECLELNHIPEVLFRKFKNMESLSVNNCGIVHMGPSFLNECGILQHIDLRFNKIESVRGDSVKNCAVLETINISNNFVTRIDSDVFKCNPKLNVIIDSLQIGAPKNVHP